MAFAPLSAQKPEVRRQTESGAVASIREALVEKARILEGRGRPDLALQLWQQILLSDPKNIPALEGVAREYKLMGENDKANTALNNLRAVSPNDPEIARIEALASTKVESQQLKQAGRLAQQKHPEEAMRIYRQLYGNAPPNGNIALAYYQTLYATKGGKAEAIAGMRELAAKNPGYEPYAIALGTMLTYDARTRAEGMRILEAHSRNPDAEAAYRQALLWNAANPDTAGELEQYLKTHPNDRQVADALKTARSTLARMNSGIARTPEERAAFAALNANRLDEAEKRFMALLDRDPSNGRVAAGMGFLRMKQQNFSAAISFLSQAEADGYQVKTVADALASARFWFTMSEATQAFDNNRFELARQKFTEALRQNPRSPEALNGLAGLDVKQQQFPQAADTYEQLLRIRPADATAWRGLFLAYARDGQDEKAMAAMSRFPAAVKAALARDPDYLRTLAGIYESQGRTAEAQRVLAQALTLPFPDNGSTLALGTKLQYAAILNEVKRYDEAAALYTQVLNQNPTNLSAWEGLVTAHHNLGQDSQAIADIQRMPAATYEAAIADPGFLSMLGAIYQQANQYEVAQGFLERAVQQESAAGGHPAADLELQLASIYLFRNEPERSYAIYRQVLGANPENASAWQGLINALHATHRDTEAIRQIAQLPAGVRKQLESNVAFVQTEAGLYAGAGDTARALQYSKAVVDYYAKRHELPPADIDVQNAWLLYNTGDDRALYPQLMRLGGRTDLTVAQREAVQNIWANWSVRRAGQAFDNGNYRRAVDILDAASLAFPMNLDVRKAVAGGYVRVGRAKEALALFKTVPMQNATSGDFQGAVGAALAANDKTQAEIWLREALDRYPRDPAILTLAARYEQARGDNERAADYYRAALAVMPKATPVDRLAHILVNPEEDTKVRKAVTAADLQRLLNPDDEPFPRTTKLPALPAYGPDPYDGAAPVLLNQPAKPSAPAVNSPASNVMTGPDGEDNEVIAPLPDGALSQPDFGLHPVAVSSGGTGAAMMGAQTADASDANTVQVYVPNVQIQANPPHSMASDAWKGLIFSLMAGHRNAEALAELGKMPRDVRDQLEADVAFVQGLASLYLSVGDVTRAQAYLNRVEDYYLLHRARAPAGIEIQRAWLLYNLKDDVALYPVLLRLDARTDLTPAQRADVENMWASWAVRRASTAMDRGNLVRGVEILQAASQDYPGNLAVRRAVAEAYARVGRGADAVALFKTIPMNAAAAGDYQGAISAALSAGNMAQAEVWLRQALVRYPNNPEILGLAARFEQARGNNERATAFWRAALAAMPPGSSIKPLPSVIAFPPGTYQAPAPGDTKKLLDPRLDPLPTANDQVPLPTYPTPPGATASPAFAAPSLPQSSTPASTPAPMPQVSRPSSAPLPLPSGLSSDEPEDSYGGGQGSDSPSDSQLSENPSASIHNLSNSPVAPLAPPASDDSASTAYAMAQYTPSAQEATTGAYSAPNKTPPQPAQPEAPAATAPPAVATKPRPSRRRRTRRSRSGATTAPPQQTLGNAPIVQNQEPLEIPSEPQAAPDATAAAPQQTEPASTGSGLSDQELEERNLPPLRGPWVRTQREAAKLSPRDLAEQQLAAIESSYSGWLGGTGDFFYRSGALGFSHLANLEAPFEVSLPVGYHARFTVVAKPVFLDSGQADGTATMTVSGYSNTTFESVSIPEPIGTLTDTGTAPPAQQNAVGLGGEIQLAFPQFAIAAGYTPEGFLVSTFTGRLYWKPGNGPFTFNFVRDSVKDSQLSYAGLRDPAGNSLDTEGAIWGGVVYNQATAQFGRGDAQSGFYFSAGGQYLSGYNVKTNTRFDGTGGAYWRAYADPEYGSLSIGINFFAMHYANNQNAFTYGMGGYFSPQGYFLSNIPFTWAGHYGTRWHYNIMGAMGVQAFQEDSTPLWPLAAQKSLETSTIDDLVSNAMLPSYTSVGANYDLRGHLAYQIGPHWFVGGTFEANDSRDYNAASGGFFVRYLFREQPSTVTSPTGDFPSDGFRPFSVP